MKHHTNSIFGLGLSIVALIYLLGCKNHESSFSVSDLFNGWDSKGLSLFDRKDSKDVFLCKE